MDAPTETTTAATGKARFSLKAWAEARGFEPRHVLALTGAEAKALSEAARAYTAAAERADKAQELAQMAAEALVPFMEKLKAIKAAAQ